MVPTFSNPTNTLSVQATVPSTINGFALTEGDVRLALEQVARDNGVQVNDLTVTLIPGERTVTLTEAEYNALRQGGNDGA